MRSSMSAPRILALVAFTCCTAVSAYDGRNAVEFIQMQNAEDLLSRSHVKLTCNVTALVGKSEYVKVKWSGVSDPSFDDWVGVLAPADADVSTRAPVKYKLAAIAVTHIILGEGDVTFTLENVRTDMRIGFFRNGFANPHLVAQTPVIRVANPNRPAHARLALTATPSEMLVQWTTADTEGGTVKWGANPGAYTGSVEARDITYSRSDMCGGAASGEGWLDPGVFHYGLVTGLKPFTRYYYQFGAQETGWSDEFSFLSAPEVGPETEVKVLALADMGQGEVDGSNEQSEMRPSLNTSSLLLADSRREDYSLVLHHGDISYARGYVTQWDRFHEQVEPLAARLPYMTSLGNHERDWPGSGYMEGDDSGGECGVATERRFLMPTPAQDAYWFSYDYGPVHFIHYSTEQPFGPGSPQYAFLKHDLESIDRTRTPWVVLGGHRPIYIDSTNMKPPDGDQPVAHDLREALEDLLMDHHVDVTLQGHHHSFQRTCPVYKGECQGADADGVPLAPIHLVIGNAGAGLCLNTRRPTPEIFEKVHLWWGYARLHATGTRLAWEFVTDLDGSVFDTLVIDKPKDWGKRWHSARNSLPKSPREARPKWWWEHDTIQAPPQSEPARAAARAAAQSSLARASRRAVQLYRWLLAQALPSAGSSPLKTDNGGRSEPL